MTARDRVSPRPRQVYQPETLIDDAGRSPTLLIIYSDQSRHEWSPLAPTSAVPADGIPAAAAWRAVPLGAVP
jgi:hypothetical protein